MKVAVLPCNGLDKSLGSLSREVALQLANEDGCKLICPVFCNNSPDHYAKSLSELPLLVIDGCATRCATKLANRLELKIDDRIQLVDEIKRLGGSVGKSLILGEPERELARRIVADWTRRQAEEPVGTTGVASTTFVAPTEFLEATHDKYVFKVPASGFYFNENDVWVQVKGDRARVGISDFAQQQLSDINFCQPVEVGREVDQCGDVASIESSKAMNDLVSPVAGRVVAVNPALADSPEVINQDPYGQGWIAELELRDFDADRELLLDGPAYLELVKRKAAEY